MWRGSVIRTSLPQETQLVVDLVASLSSQNLSRFLSSDSKDHPIDTSRTKRDNRIRYFVINNRPSDALELLQRSLYRTPVTVPAGNSKKLRFLKLPPATVCNKVLDSAAQSRDPNLIKQAAELASALQIQGVDIATRTTQSLLASLASTGQTEKALLLLDDWLRSHHEDLEDDLYANNGPLQIFCTLLEAVAALDDTESIMHILARMARTGLAPTPRTMVSLIRCFMRLGHVDTAYGMVGWMKKSDIELTRPVYTALLTLPSSHQNSIHDAQTVLKRATVLYEDVLRKEKDSSLLSEHFYAAFFNVCGRARDLQATRKIWNDVLENSSIQPDAVLYSTMIDAYAKCNDVKGALKVYNELKKEGKIKPDLTLYRTLLSAVQKMPVVHAKTVWNDMVENTVEPDIVSYCAYLRCLLENGEEQSALELLASAGTSNTEQQRKEEQERLYEQAISFAVNDARLDTFLLSMIDQMNRFHVQHSIGSLGDIFKAYARRRTKNQWSWLLTSPPEITTTTPTAVMNPSQRVVMERLIDELVRGIASPRTEETTTADDNALGNNNNNSVDAETESNNLMLLTTMIGRASLRGDFDLAFDLFHRHTQKSASTGWHGWWLQLLLFGARNSNTSSSSSSSAGIDTSKDMQGEDTIQPSEIYKNNILSVIIHARKWSKESGSGWWFDVPTQRAVGRILRKGKDLVET